MPSLKMQIMCPNCATAYEVPDAVFGGRARKLRCESCGTQWRVAPPGAEPEPEAPITPPAAETIPQAPAPPKASPIWPEYIAPAITEEPRVFGQPADDMASSEVRKALNKERPEPVPQGPIQQNHVLATDQGADSNDPFINLVNAARSRAIEFEPEPVHVPPVSITSPAFFGTLLGLFVVSMVGLFILHH